MLARDIEESFTAFVKETEPRLRHALVAALGQDRGLEATSDALSYAFENWDRTESMENPVGYLYRVGNPDLFGDEVGAYGLWVGDEAVFEIWKVGPTTSPNRSGR